MPEPAAADLSYIVEASSTLVGTWTALATKTGTGSWTWNVGDSVTISINPRRFLRLRTQVNQ